MLIMGKVYRGIYLEGGAATLGANFPLRGEILSTAIHVEEHPLEGISTAHLRPFVPTISNEKSLLFADPKI